MINAKQATMFYLLSKGADKVSATWAATRIEEVCWSNKHFSTNHRNRRCTLDANGMVKRLAITADFVYPDTNARGTRRLVYTVKFHKSGKVTTNLNVEAA